MMEQYLLDLRIYIFLGLLLLLFSIQLIKPFKAINNIKAHAFKNLGLQAINALCLLLLIPSGLYLIAENMNFGLFYFLDWPYWAEFLSSFLIFDLLIYWQHRLFHVLPTLWKIHKVHHTDLYMETTTALRFHPIEIMLSLSIKLVAIFLIGPPALAVVIFEVLLNSNAMFHHSNFILPKVIDRFLNKIVITQSQHYVHHSKKQNETNSNYGFFLSLWDYIFKTRKLKNLNKVEFGLKEYKDDLSLKQILLLPFK